MIFSYLKITYRNLLKNKGFSIINILGLAVGLAACVLIFEYLTFEFSYDTFHTKADRIYRIINDRTQDGRLLQHSTMSYPAVSPAMANDYDEIEDYSRILVPHGDALVKTEKGIFPGDKCLFVDNSFLKIFDFPLLIGNKSSVLEEPRSIIVSEKIASKYYQHEDLSQLVGKELYWGSETEPYTITGVFQDIPENSHLQVDLLLSFSSLGYTSSNEEIWTQSYTRHYLLLKEGVNPDILQSKFANFSERYFHGNKVTGSFEKFTLQPLKDIHLYSDTEFDYAKTANGRTVWVMLLISMIILVIACINYINLTLSRSIERAKEVGIRKTMGAARTQLINQFILESLVLSFLSFAIALLIIQLVQPSFNELLGTNLSLVPELSLTNNTTTIILVSAVLAGFILSGFYPALLLSSFIPATVLKGKLIHSHGGQLLRKSLIVFQFMISCTLITTALIVSIQLKYMDHADLGLNIQRTLVVSPPLRTAFDSAYLGKVHTFKNSVQQLSGVAAATTSSHVPGTKPYRTFEIRFPGISGSTSYTMNQLVVDEDFFKMYQVKLLAGRLFEASDCNYNWSLVDKIILNRKVVQLLDQDLNEIIGDKLTIGNKEWTVIGVVEDFHQQSLHNKIEPTLFSPDYDNNNPVSIQLVTNNYRDVIAQIKSQFEKTFPDNAFAYSILEDNFNNQYRNDRQFSRVITIFTGLAIIISCLGLIGLSSYAAIQRTKEIGIRKVLGASISSIISLLSIDFMKWVLLATFLSIPATYLISNKWLMNFAYRISPDWITFLLPLVTVLIIASITIGSQVLKTARTNPAETLKSE